MILTGVEIAAARLRGEVVIEPFDQKFIEPNSYAFHLGSEILEFDGQVFDPREPPIGQARTVPLTGFVLQPDRFYLGHTLERIGGVSVSSELYANHSTAGLGMWVQTSAPLGHVGAVINWTLEICVTQPLRVYPNMRLGKICFWKNFGSINSYSGRYVNSTTVTASRIKADAQ